MNPIPLIKVEHSLLKLACSFEIITASKTPIRVISILGKARMGKSTFLNCLITSLTDSDAYVFPTQENDEHCTQGIDMYILKEKNLIFLDCQGVEYDDSSQDSKLLLIAYLLSDIVIFNERNMLSNSTLHSFQPMVAFIQYLHLEQLRKPHLYFRIADVDLKLDAGSNLNNMLAAKTDHYQSIRDSIKLLFSSASAVKTAALDRAEKKLLINHLYKGMLLSKENGFAAAIDDLMSIMGSKLKTEPKTFSEWTNQVSTLIDLINRNEKIDYKKLDVVELLAFKEITEFLNAVDPSLYESIMVDGTHVLYMSRVHSRLQMATKVLEEFKRNFSAVSDSSGEKGRRFAELQTRLLGPVDAATEQTIKMARAAINPRIVTEFKTWTYKVQNESYKNLVGKKGVNVEHAFWAFLASKYKKIHDEIAGKLYSPVVEEFENWWSHTIMGDLKKIISANYEKECIELDRVRPLIAAYLDQTLNTDIINVLFRESTAADLRRPITDILKEMQTKVTDKFMTKLAEMEITFNGIELRIQPGGASGTFGELLVNPCNEKLLTTKMVNIKGTAFYPLIEEALTKITAVTAAPEWHKKLLGKRRQMLGYMKISTDVSLNNLLIVNNPGTQFVLMSPDSGGPYIITKDQYKKEERPILYKTLAKMVQYGIIPDIGSGYHYLYRTNMFSRNNIHSRRNVIMIRYKTGLSSWTLDMKYFHDLFNHYYMKTYMQQRVLKATKK